MNKIYRKILNSDGGDFKILVKVVCFRRNFMAHFRELPEDQGGITCMMGRELDRKFSKILIPSGNPVGGKTLIGA